MADQLAAELDWIDRSICPTPHDDRHFKTRASQIADLLLRSKAMTECRLIGSVSRSTALRQNSDVDLLAVFDPGEDTRRPEQLIARVAGILGDSGVNATRRKVSVRAKFGDPPKVDILPAVRTEDSPGCLISTGSANPVWQRFQPDILRELTARSGKRLGPRFYTVVRLIKYWNHLRQPWLRPSDLEELTCIGLRSTIEISSYPAAIARVFDLVVRWIDGDGQVQGMLGRTFIPDDFNRRAREIATESHALALAMSRPDAAPAMTLLEDFFGGGLAAQPLLHLHRNALNINHTKGLRP